jgi:hypothetical protein
MTSDLFWLRRHRPLISSRELSHSNLAFQITSTPESKLLPANAPTADVEPMRRCNTGRKAPDNRNQRRRFLGDVTRLAFRKLLL